MVGLLCDDVFFEMNIQKLFEEGFQSFNQSKNVFDVSPYKRQEDRGMGIIGLQPELTYFFNGWETARGAHENKTGYSLFLDDFRFPNWITWINLPTNNWLIARHSKEFVNIIEKNGSPQFVSFDFDLDRHGLIVKEECYDGAWCAEWLVKYCRDHGIKLPPWGVHSTNREGKSEISKILSEK